MTDSDSYTRFLRITEGDKSAWMLCGINRYYGSKQIPDDDFDFRFTEEDDKLLREIFKTIRGSERGCGIVFFQDVDSFTSRGDNIAAANLMAVRCFRLWRSQHKKLVQSGVHVMGALETHIAISRQDPDSLYQYLKHEVLIIQAADYLISSEKTQPGVLNSLMSFIEDRNNRGFYTILVCSGFDLIGIMHEVDLPGPSVDYSSFRAFLLYRCLCILPRERNPGERPITGVSKDFLEALSLDQSSGDTILRKAKFQSKIEATRNEFNKRILRRKKS